MIRTELGDRLAGREPTLAAAEFTLAAKLILDALGPALASGERVEVRGFGSFSLKHREARVARNPKTGKTVQIAAKSVPHFKPGKDLRDRVDAGR